jgi:dTDP-4-amino-4,6-dideoxygalactose transaminase
VEGLLYCNWPVLVDVDLYNMNISIDAIRKQLHPKNKAIVPVHLFGEPIWKLLWQLLKSITYT